MHRHAPSLDIPTHKHIVDKFYTVGTDRVRVSHDAAGSVTECIVKEKLQHLDFWNGKPRCIDFRISTNRGRRVELFKTGELQGEPTSTIYEVEVELKELDLLRAEALKAHANQPNEFVRIATALLETVRTLAQYALPGALPPSPAQRS
jgi:hypothetical protein